MPTISDFRPAIEAKTKARVRSYFYSRDEWNQSRSLKNLIEQAIREYEHRAVLELVQNAHDAQPAGNRTGRILVKLDHDEGQHGALVVANSGRPFTSSNFDAICDVAQSDKRADEGIGNKGIGFKSTLQLCRNPEIYSSSPNGPGPFGGYCFRFAGDSDFHALAGGDAVRSRELAADVFHLCLPVPLDSVPDSVKRLADDGFVTAVRMVLKSEAARKEAQDEVAALERRPSALLFLRRIEALVIEEVVDGTLTRRKHSRRERPVGDVSPGTTVTEVDLGAAGHFLVGEQVVDPVAFKEAIAASVRADRMSEAWNAWKGEARVGVAAPLDECLEGGRLFTFLPMGERAEAPLRCHVNGPFFAKLARVDFEEGVPLNEFLLDEVAALTATLVLSAASGKLPLAPTTLADLLSWTDPAHARLVKAFASKGVDLDTAPVLPLRSTRRRGDLRSTRSWDDGERRTLTAKAIRRSASVPLLDSSITGSRLTRLGDLAEAITGHDLNPSQVEVATWAEAIASGAAKGKFNPRWWEAFYDELAAALSDPRVLRGRRILVDDDGNLQRCADPASDARSPTPFFSPRADDAPSDTFATDLRIPKTLKRQTFFVNQAIRWTRRSGSLLSKTPGRGMLESGGLVNEYRASELFAVIGRALGNRPSDARSQDALRWLYHFIRSREEPPWNEVTPLDWRVPAQSGDWILARTALFSREWEIVEAELLGDLISRVGESSEEIAALRSRVIAAPADWPFSIGDREEALTFLKRLGVRGGLWPVEIPRSLLEAEGRFFEDLSALTSVPLGPDAQALWRRSVGPYAPQGLRPYTQYRSRERQTRLPGQDDYAKFDDAARRIYASLVVFGLEQWHASMLKVQVRRYNDALDTFTWPTPAWAFLEHSDWVPMAEARARSSWYFEQPSSAWSHGGGDEVAPAFAPLSPHAFRRLAEQRPRAQSRLRELGIKYWDAADTAASRLRLLARLLAEDAIPETAAAAFKKAYEDAWNELILHGPGDDPFSGEELDAIIVTRRGQLAPLQLDRDPAGEPVYVQDSGVTQALRLLDQRGAALIRLRYDIGEEVAKQLERYLGERLRRVSKTEVTVRVDGSLFEPADIGELLVGGNRGWLVDLVASLVEFKSGQFRRLSGEAIRRIVATLHRIRMVFAQRLEALVAGEPVNLGSHVLAIPDEEHPTIILMREGLADDEATLQAAAPAIAELIGYPELADSIRLSLIDLQQAGWSGNEPPLSAIAAVVGEPEHRIREILVDASLPLLDLGRLVVPLVAVLSPEVALELWRDLDNFASEAAVAVWLAERMPGGSARAAQVMAASALDDLDGARVAMGIPLRTLNEAIDGLGPPFQRLRDDEAIERAFGHFVGSRRECILASLRTAFLPTFRAGESLERYVELRDLASLCADPTWAEDYMTLEDNVASSLVNAWLSEVGAPAIDVDIPALSILDELRGANRAHLHDLVDRARLRVDAWEQKNSRALSGLPGSPGEVLDLADGAGWLDFEALSEETALAWLVSGSLWPEGMPLSLALGELDLSEDDVARAAVRAEQASARRSDEALHININGQKVDAGQENYASIVDLVRASIAPSLLETPPELAKLDELPPPRSGRRSGGGGVTAARRPRLSREQSGAVGLAGEVVALDWLRAQYGDRGEISWRSGYRNMVLGGAEGDDSLGFDMEVLLPSRRLLFEVKATMGAECEFDLTDAEIRAAQSLGRSDRYHILFVTRVLAGDERAIHLLPNPFSVEGVGRFRTIGAGLRLRFRVTDR